MVIPAVRGRKVDEKLLARKKISSPLEMIIFPFMLHTLTACRHRTLLRNNIFLSSTVHWSFIGHTASRDQSLPKEASCIATSVGTFKKNLFLDGHRFRRLKNRTNSDN